MLWSGFLNFFLIKFHPRFFYDFHIESIFLLLSMAVWLVASELAIASILDYSFFCDCKEKTSTLFQYFELQTTDLCSYPLARSSRNFLHWSFNFICGLCYACIIYVMFDVSKCTLSASCKLIFWFYCIIK